ncbi:MAG: hypothetical protein WC677_04970 [Clostridia bacterium]|jgi:hypothetical protein
MDVRVEEMNSEKFLGFILAFLTCLIAFLMCCLIIASATAFNSNFMTKSIQKSAYSSLLLKEINDQFYNLADISGVPKTVFNGLVTEDTIKNSSIKYFNTSMKSEKFTSDFDQTSIKLKSNLENYVNSVDNKNISEVDLQKNIDEFVNACTEIYNSSIEINYVPDFGKVAFRINTFIVFVILGLAIIYLILMGMLIMLYRRHKTMLRFIAYSFSGLTLMLFAVPVITDILGIIPRVAINSKALYTLSTDLLNWVISTFYIYGSIILVLVICLVIMYITKTRTSSKEN